MTIVTVETRRGNRFKARYYVNGIARYKTFDRKADAKTFLEDQRRARYGVGVRVEQDTVNQLWERHYNTVLKPRRAKATLITYKYLWDAHIRDSLGKLPAQKLCDDPNTIDQWYAEKSQTVGAASLRKTMIILGSTMKQGVRWRKIPFNPITGLEKPSGKRKRAVRPPTPAEVWEIIGLMPDDASKLVVGICGFAGLRPAEALALEWRDVREKTLIVDKALKNLGDPDPDEIEAGVTKTAVIRTVPMNDDLRRVFELYGGGGTRGRCTRSLDPCRYKFWSRYVYKKLVAESFPDATRPYDLRHAYASRRIHEGVALPMVAAELGHSQEMCMSTYSHVFAEAVA